jgi:hypothetical protein
MDALVYIFSLRWPSSVRWGAALTLSTLVCWLNLKAASQVPQLFPSLYQSPTMALLWGGIVMAAGLVAIGTGAAIILLIPLYCVQRSSTILRRWMRSRFAEELLATGTTGTALCDGITGFAIRWWMVAALPGGLTAAIIFPQLTGPWLGWAVVAYLVGTAALLVFSLCLTTWHSLSSRLAVIPGILLAVAPGLACATAGLSAATLLGFGLWVIIVGRLLHIRGLEQLKARGRQKPGPGPGADATIRALASVENPIEAREHRRAWSRETRWLPIVAMFVAGLAAAAGPWMIASVLVVVVLMNSYQGAVVMSQIVTRERDGDTLELLTSTPLSEDVFLRGWLRTVILPQWRYHAMLLVGAALAFLILGQATTPQKGPLVTAAGLCLALPVLAAYAGASVAAQARTREHIGSHLLLAYTCFVLVGVPQLLAGSLLLSPPGSLLGLAVVTGVLCWALHVIATRNLRRVFLPQP